MPTTSSPTAASFCIPKAAIQALIDAPADAITIGAYLTLAAHTDQTGQFSTAGLKAIRENLGIDKPRAEKAIATLASILSRPVPADPSATKTGKTGKSQKQLLASMLPLIYPRDRWLKTTATPVPGPEPPKEKVVREDPRIVRFILPTFDEPLQARVWIGGGLVKGDELIPKPLRELKNCGDVAARLLLALYEGQDLKRWYGIPPSSGGFFERQYRHWTVYGDGQHVLLFAIPSTQYGNTNLFNRLLSATGTDEGEKSLWLALAALESTGFIYETVCLLNRLPANLTREKKKDQDEIFFGKIPPDAELLCDLDYPNPAQYGPVTPAECALGPAYRDTAKALRIDLDSDSTTNFLAVLRRGQPAMIAGLYRLRYRVINARNAFIEEVEGEQLDRAKTAWRLLNYSRKAMKLTTLQSSSIFLQSPFNAVQ